MRFVGRRWIRAVAHRIPGVIPVVTAVRIWYRRHRRIAELDYPGAQLRIHVPTRSIADGRTTPLAKEPWTVAWLERNVRSGDVVYDIGANIGVYSLIAASLARGSGTVVAFEPAYANYAALCDNLVLNGLADGVIPLPVVLGRETELGTLTYTDVEAGAALHTIEAAASGAYRQPVLTYALDDLIEWFDLPPPTLVKLDVDGAEATVLAGAHRTLARSELRSLVVEVENDRSEDVLAELERSGFSLAERFEEREGKPLPGVWYGVFVRGR